MIVRMWFGRARAAQAARYAEHVINHVVPSLATIPGFRHASILRRDVGEEAEFAVLTSWDSIDAVKRFAGPEPGVAVVEPAARALLSSFDETVRHFDVIFES